MQVLNLEKRISSYKSKYKKLMYYRYITESEVQRIKGICSKRRTSIPYIGSTSTFLYFHLYLSTAATAMWCIVVWCNVVWCNVVLVWCNVVLVWCNVVLVWCNVVLVWCNVVLVWCNVVLVWCNVVLVWCNV